jgi:uncharacterized Ntn-hydrolase superfamily protein
MSALAPSLGGGMSSRPDPALRIGTFTSTYTVVARCERTGMLGMAITTSSICVAARCVWVEASLGAVATQNLTDPRLGRLGLELLRQGYGAKAVVEELVRAGAYPEYRQLACVDRDGHSATWTGAQAFPTAAELTDRNLAVAGNLLASADVVHAMADAFRRAPDRHLAERLLRALAAGKAAGGEVGRNERSAGLKIVDREPFPLVDLRVDWDEAGPVERLGALWERYQPEMERYRLRAIDPRATLSG